MTFFLCTKVRDNVEFTGMLITISDSEEIQILKVTHTRKKTYDLFENCYTYPENGYRERFVFV